MQSCNQESPSSPPGEVICGLTAIRHGNFQALGLPFPGIPYLTRIIISLGSTPGPSVMEIPTWANVHGLFKAF